MSFSEKFSMLRDAQRLQQTELAKILDVSKQTVSNWENNNIQPSADMVVRVAAYFGVSTDYLLDLTDRVYIEVTGLDDERVAHLRQIAKDIGAQIMEEDQ